MSADPALLVIPAIPSSNDPPSGNDIATDLRTIERWAKYLKDSIWPLGVIRSIATPNANLGWLLCDGRDLDRIEYTALFNLIGTTYGSASASTFKIPDLRGRVPVGAGIASGGTVSRTLGSEGGGDSFDAVASGTSFSVPNSFFPFTVVNYEIRAS